MTRRSKLRLGSLCGVLSGLVFSSGCGDEPAELPSVKTCADYAGRTELPDVPLTYSTEHLDIYVKESFLFCAGSADLYERFYVDTAADLGIEVEQRVPVFLGNMDWGNCSPNAGGCRNSDGVVFSSPPFVWHELAHAANCELRSVSANPLFEGFAVSAEPQILEFRYDPREFITVPWSENFTPYYHGAGHFVRWLLEVYGPEPFREAFLRSPYNDGEGMLQVLEEAYDMSSDALFDEYMETSPAAWLPRRQCEDVPVLEPSGAGWQFEGVFDCDSPTTQGPYVRHAADWYHAQSMYQSVLLKVETAGTYRFQRDFIETGLFLVDCREGASLGLSEEEYDELSYPKGGISTLQGYTDIELEVGSYRLDILRPSAEPHVVSVDIQPL